MDRYETLRELATLCRGSHTVALGVLAYLAGPMTQEELSAAVRHAQELQREWEPVDGHLALVRERYGLPEGRG